jgi:hypothetical protein
MSAALHIKRYWTITWGWDWALYYEGRLRVVSKEFRSICAIAYLEACL